MFGLETTLYLALFAATLLASLLGLVIVFQAFRGYRRNDSDSMLYLAIGFALITVAPFGLSLVVTLVAPSLEAGTFIQSSLLPLGSRLFEIAGLAVILYSLYRE